jgi:SAM-dependent methyltransferase
MVIEKMSILTQQTCPEMTWECKDMRNLEGLADNNFDVVLDKGALDALWADAGSQWDPEEQTKANVIASIKETYRVLKHGGLYLMISFGQPHFRKPLLSTPGWSIEVIEFGMYFIYVMKKE